MNGRGALTTDYTDYTDSPHPCRPWNPWLSSAAAATLCARRASAVDQACGSLRREAQVGIIRRRWQIPPFCSLKAALLVSVLVPSLAPAQFQVLPDSEPQRAFAGEGRAISLRLRNSGDRLVKAALRMRLYQADSATAASWGEAAWKTLAVLPGQTVLESVSLTFPAVRAETRFLVQWLDGTNKVIGVTEVLVYPSDLLKDLQPLAGKDPLGVLDPSNELKPLLKALPVECQDLEDTGLENYRGRLAILRPFESRTQMREGLPSRVKALAQKGVAVVWIQPPPEEKRRGLKPSFYALLEGKAAVVVAQADLVANLAESPQSQLNLIQLARFALDHEPPRLSGLTLSQYTNIGL
jgi:hypothetical protein